MKMNLRNLAPLVAGFLALGLSVQSKAQDISSVTVQPSTVSGGTKANGKVTLKASATAAVKITLGISNTVALVSKTVTVEKGKSTASFEVSTTNPDKVTEVELTATDPGNKTAKTKFTVVPFIRLKEIAIEPDSVVGGDPAAGKLMLTAKAGAKGLVVKLSSDKAFATVPATVTVDAGKDSAIFKIETKAVTTPGTAKITAADTALAGLTASLTVNPAPKLKDVKLEPTTVFGGRPAGGAVTLTGKAPKGGITIKLSSDQKFATVPATVKVLEGKDRELFPIQTTVVTKDGVAKITAEDGAANKSMAELTVKVAVPELKEFILEPKSVVSGKPSKGTVVISFKAATGGFAIKLASDNSAAKVPATVTVAAGTDRASFDITTTVVTAETKATIEAKDPANVALKAVLTLTVPAPAPKVKELLLDPKSVTGGSPSKGSVILSAKAPAGGVKIDIASDKPFAKVPKTVTVEAGKDTATFPIETGPVQTESKASISATDPGKNSVKSELTVTPPKVLVISMNGRRLFEPKVATVKPGMIIEWSNDDSSMAHAVNLDVAGIGPDSETKFPNGMVPGDKYRWTVPADLKPGKKIYYRCKYHASAGDGTNFGTGMVGVIVIQ